MSEYQDEQVPFPSPGRLKRELKLQALPFWARATLWILAAAATLPLALIARARFSTSDKPRVHFIQDMDNQPRYSTQQPSPIFADGRAMRQPPPGTVSRDASVDDAVFETGYRTVNGEIRFAETLPASLTVDHRLLQRGQQMFGVYCAACHGLDGSGNGPVHQRALELNESKWVPPMSLHKPEVRARTDGELYNTIRNGTRSMPPHGSQIRTADRWAIVAYVRALQRSQDGRPGDVPPEQMNLLKE